MGANVGNNPGIRRSLRVPNGPIRTMRILSMARRPRWSGMGHVMTNRATVCSAAIVVGPKGAKYRDPKTGADLTNKMPGGRSVIPGSPMPGMEIGRTIVTWRCSSQDEAHHPHELHCPMLQNVAGLTGVNYRSEPYKSGGAGLFRGQGVQPAKPTA